MWITGFDVPCVSTVYLDKPIGGHSLMQTIARANRVYDDEKENGLIVDYGNVYEQLKKAYLVYGNSDNQGKKPTPDKKLKLAELVSDLKEALAEARQFLSGVQFDLDTLTQSETPMHRLSNLATATNAVCLNEKTRYEFEALASNVLRKYKALYPEEELQPYIDECNAIEAIYKQLNQKTESADISAVIKKLQAEVDMVITVDSTGEVGGEIDISQLDFDKLQQAFGKSTHKKQVMFDLHKAVEAKLKRMVQQNPLRLKFYKEYELIIEKYNNGKDIHAVEKAFDDVNEFINTKLNPESSRAFSEGLDEGTLAIFDILKKPTLTPEEIDEVKKVAKETLKRLNQEVLMFQRWRGSGQLKAKAITIIRSDIRHLPIVPYTDEDLLIQEGLIYQHIYSSYQGGSSIVEGLIG